MFSFRLFAAFRRRRLSRLLLQYGQQKILSLPISTGLVDLEERFASSLAFCCSKPKSGSKMISRDDDDDEVDVVVKEEDDDDDDDLGRAFARQSSSSSLLAYFSCKYFSLKASRNSGSFSKSTLRISDFFTVERADLMLNSSSFVEGDGVRGKLLAILSIEASTAFSDSFRSPTCLKSSKATFRRRRPGRKLLLLMLSRRREFGRVLE